MTGLIDTTARGAKILILHEGHSYLPVLTNVANFLFIGLEALSFELFKVLNSDLYISQS